MKRLIYVLVAITTFSSCELVESYLNKDDSNDEIVEGFAQELTFTTSINSLTKVTESNFETGDVIAVTAYDASGALINNATQYKYNGSLFTSDDPIIYDYEDAVYSFYAIYPTISSLQSSIDFYAQSDQSIDGAYTQSDMLFASLTSSDTVPQLTFNHTMSSIVVNIIDEEASSVTFYAKIALRYGVQTNSTTTLGDSQSVIPAINGSSSYKAIVAPQTVVTGTTIATCTVGSLTHDWVLDADFEMVSGKQYIFNWSIADREVTLDSIINEWDIVDMGTIESK